MLTAWFGLVQTMMEAHQVVCLRTLRLMGGGTRARREVQLMLNEKVDAAFNAGLQVARGLSAEQIVHGYQVKIRSNRRRLLKRLP